MMGAGYETYYYCNGTPTSAGPTANWCSGSYPTSTYNACGPNSGSCQQNCGP
jgi:hypothetical protein